MMQEHFIDLRELAARTTLSRRTLRAHIQSLEDPLPAIRVGGKLLFDVRAVDRWLARRRVSSDHVNINGDAEAILRELADG